MSLEGSFRRRAGVDAPDGGVGAGFAGVGDAGWGGVLSEDVCTGVGYDGVTGGAGIDGAVSLWAEVASAAAGVVVGSDGAGKAGLGGVAGA